MTKICASCGAELFAGQQFCRRCGARTGALEGEAPTRILSDAPPPPDAQGTTALPPRATGEQRWPAQARPTEHHGPIGHAQYTSPLPVGADAGVSKRRPGWLVPTVLLLLITVCAVGIGGLAMLVRRAPFQVGFAGRGPQPPPPPPPPGAGPLDESAATVTADETIWTQNFELSETAVVSLRNMQGDITVEGWDGEGVEVRLTKRGGSAEDRRRAPVAFRQTPDLLSFASSETGGVKVFYEVRVPRAALGRVELNTRSGDVRVSDLGAPLDVKLTNGDIELVGVSGPVEAELVNGDIGVTYRGAEREGPQEFKTVNGDVRLRLTDGMEGPVRASVVNGEIEVDSRLGFQAQRKKPGWFVDARLGPEGEGGPPLTAQSVNGSIKFDKQ